MLDVVTLAREARARFEAVVTLDVVTLAVDTLAVGRSLP